MVSDRQLTLVSALDRLPSTPDRGFRFVNLDRSENYYSYQQLRSEAYRRAAFLQATHGLKKGERIAIVVPENNEFILNFLAASVAGLVPVPIYPQATFKSTQTYMDTLCHILKASGGRKLIASKTSLSLVEGTIGKVENLEEILTTEAAFEGETPAFEAPTIHADDLCFLQFTSGSTSQPKGVMVTHANLVANSAAFLGPQGLNLNQDDIGVSWLPLYHDMGLIGFALGPLIQDLPVVLLPTAAFARSPILWLETITKHRATVTFAPNFAYQLVTRRVKPKDLPTLDLSTIRLSGCGAEPIRAQTLRDFGELLKPAGFHPNALLPSYGMAESTLAITFHQRGTPMITDRVDAEAMKENVARPASPDTDKTIELVSCGTPFEGHELQIVSDEGKPVGERVVGEIYVKGPSVTSGYFQNPEATAKSWTNGWLQTGDLGYIANGNLFICGRVKDLIIIRGANHYPQDIEWIVGDIDGVRRGNVVAFSVLRDGTEQLIIAAEGNSTDAARLREEITRKINEQIGLDPSYVAIVALGTLPKTSSGKAQRRKTRDLYEDGLLAEHK